MCRRPLRDCADGRTRSHVEQRQFELVQLGRAVDVQFRVREIEIGYIRNREAVEIQVLGVVERQAGELHVLRRGRRALNQRGGCQSPRHRFAIRRQDPQRSRATGFDRLQRDAVARQTRLNGIADTRRRQSRIEIADQIRQRLIAVAAVRAQRGVSGHRDFDAPGTIDRQLELGPTCVAIQRQTSIQRRINRADHDGRSVDAGRCGWQCQWEGVRDRVIAVIEQEFGLINEDRPPTLNLDSVVARSRVDPNGLLYRGADCDRVAATECVHDNRQEVPFRRQQATDDFVGFLLRVERLGLE